MGLLLGPKALVEAVAEPRKHGLPLLLFWILVPVLAMVVGAVIASRSFNAADGPEPEPAEQVSLDDSDETPPPVAIVEEGEKEEEPLVTDPNPPLTTEAPVSEPPQETVIADIEVPEEEADEPSAGAELQVLPNRLDFGEVPVGSTSGDLTVIVGNPGSAPLTIDSVAIRGVDSGEFTQDGQCDDISIEPGNECRFGVLFTPQGRGRRNARLVVSSRAAGFTRRVEMVGAGIEEE
jgi:hypothetical protein